MANEDFSNIGDVIRKAGEALAETLSAVNKAVKDLAAQAGAGVDREQMVENWIRAARMAKDGMVTALEQGFQWWERQIREQARRTASAAGGGAEKKHANPMEAWAENWRKATESFTASGVLDRGGAQAGRVGAEDAAGRASRMAADVGA